MILITFAPEFYFIGLAVVFFTFTFMKETRPRVNFLTALPLAMGGLFVTLAAVKCSGGLPGIYEVDLFSQVIKVLLATGFFLTVSLCSDMKAVSSKSNPEFYLLLSISTLAMMMLVSGVDLVIVYVSLELSSYSLYILVPVTKGEELQLEAGIKYFFIGAATSAVMLFGMAFLYGATGETHIPEIIKAVSAVPGSPMIVIGLLFTLSGFFFKLALFPFHLWAPGVYQASANQVTSYIATVTKVAAIAMIIRFAAMGRDNTYIIHLLIILSVVSMTLGNLSAMIQKDLKRLLAYSAVAQAGYILVGILSMSEKGFASALFYAAAYMLMNYLCFTVVVKVSEDGKSIGISDLAGLHSRSPLLAMSMMVGVFSLGGIPPTIGFTGKFLVFAAAMEKGYFYLVLIGMINVAVSLYYYALVVKAAYFMEPEKESPPVNLSIPFRVLIWLVISVNIAGGMYPSLLYSLARAAVRLIA